MGGAGKTFQWERYLLCYYAIRVKRIFSHGNGRVRGGVRAIIIGKGAIGVAKKGVGRPKKYSAEKLAYAVERYFRSISVLQPLLDEDGKNVLDCDGDPIVIRRYVIPPTISGLCLRLGIDRRTWLNYSNPILNGGTAERASALSRVCDDVKLRIEAYLNEELLRREKSVQGVIFNLSNNYGWSEKHQHEQRVELGEETRKVVSQNLTLDEKLRLIREAAAEIGEPEPGGEDPEDADDGVEGG